MHCSLTADIDMLGPAGRRPGSLNRAIRLKHIRCAYWRLIDGRSPRWLRNHFKVSERTIRYWVEAAPDYPDPEALALRRAIAAVERFPR